MIRTSLAVFTLLFCASLGAAEPADAPKPAGATPAAVTPAATPRPQIPPPAIADAPYGAHPKQVLDFYKAASDKPTPLVFYIHGGGWDHGSKRPVGVANYLKAGISVVSIEYRFTTEAEAAGQWPPVEWPMHDAARALQFVRSKAAEWNIDKARIGASGGSAGACTSLWLAFHDDMADAKSSDPIARESTRLWCAAVNSPQTTLDPRQMKDWTPNSKYGGHAFGFKGDGKKHTTQFEEFLAGREKVMPWIKEYSPYALVSAGDPPIYMTFEAPPALGQDAKDPTHTANFGVKLQEHCREKGVECELVYPGAPDVKHANIDSYLIEKLTSAAATSAAAATPTPRPQIPPTLADVAYGTHPRQVFDFYQAKSDKPTPVVIYIHGGGWVQGDKRPIDPSGWLAKGISFVSLNYRFTSDAEAEGHWPPVEWPLRDAARAVQFIRSKAAEWNIDKPRIGLTGGSAGACSSLWLAFHADLADPRSSDPVARESTRPWCVAVGGAQTSLDPRQMQEWTPNSNYGGHAFGFKADAQKHTTQFQEFLAGREKVLPWIKEYSPYELVSSDDPPIYLSYKTPPALGQAEKDPTHSANFGVKLQEHCREKGAECELVYPGAPDVKHKSDGEFLADKLKK